MCPLLRCLLEKFSERILFAAITRSTEQPNILRGCWPASGKWNTVVEFHFPVLNIFPADLAYLTIPSDYLKHYFSGYFAAVAPTFFCFGKRLGRKKHWANVTKNIAR